MYQVGDSITLYDQNPSPYIYEVMAVGNLTPELTTQEIISESMYVYLPEKEHQKMLGDGNSMTVFFDINDQAEASAEKSISNYCQQVDRDLVYKSRPLTQKLLPVPIVIPFLLFVGISVPLLYYRSIARDSVVSRLLKHKKRAQGFLSSFFMQLKLWQYFLLVQNLQR